VQGGIVEKVWVQITRRDGQGTMKQDTFVRSHLRMRQTKVEAIDA